MEKFGLENSFPYEHGLDFRMTRREIINSTKNETAYLFFNMKRIMLCVLKYSYTLISSLLDSAKLIMDDVVTIGSRNFPTRLQIDAGENDDQEDIWASTIILGIIIGYSISCFGKRAKNPIKLAKVYSKHSEPISIIINFMKNDSSGGSDPIGGNDTEEVMGSQLDESVLNSHIPNIEIMDETDQILKQDFYEIYDPLNGETATIDGVKWLNQLSQVFEAESNSITTDNLREVRLERTIRRYNERHGPVGHLIGDDSVRLRHLKEDIYRTNASAGRFPVQNNFFTMNGQAYLLCLRGHELVMKAELCAKIDKELFSFFIESVSFRESGILEQKQDQLEEVTHKEIICYDQNRSLAIIYHLPKIEKQRNPLTKPSMPTFSKKSLSDNKNAALILLWYSGHL
ncbi:Cnm1p DI49_1096 [Saccharomyces eubayanus]|uniref:Cnm1p n=1 Tax=Saccharomyces eubayanus TaxID=1080349 RepID=UPI0006BFA4F1|nr:hypothetical protein DI49_1096 [Saccharomyces eubayanus]KOH00388.1 hypothetical protein DI49_1096 [Saccharomyces eubayanus]